MSRESIEAAIRALMKSPELIERLKQDAKSVAPTLGIDTATARALARGDRSFLRSHGVDNALSIIVLRWFGELGREDRDADEFVVDETSPLAPADMPANLVFAGACSHVPDLLIRPEIDPPEQTQRIVGALERLRAQLAESKPDVLIVTVDNHFQRFTTAGFVVGTGPRHKGSMEFFKRPDLTLEIAGMPSLAKTIVAATKDSGLEVEASENVELDHGVIVPLRYIVPHTDIPIIPVLTQPARGCVPFSARAFGEALGRVIRVDRRRIGILATGGLSHWLDPGRFGRIDVKFDEYVLSMVRAGRGWSLADLDPYLLLEHGQYELPNWLIMMGAIGPGVRGDVYAYEATPGSGTGWTVACMQIPGPVEANR